MEYGELSVVQNALSIRGSKTGWIEAGNKSGPIMMLLHGYPDTPESWMPQIEYFAARFHIIAPYTRGSIPSAPSRILSRYSSNAVAMDHLKILDITDPSRDKEVVLVGHDLGVVQAWYLAPLLGKQLRAMTVINGLSIPQMAARITNVHQLLRSWYIYAFQIPYAAETILGRSPGRFLNFAYRKGGLPAKKRPRVSEAVRGVVDPVKQYRALLRDLPSLRGANGPRLSVPIQLLWGCDDPFLVAPNENEMRPYAQDYEIRLLKGGHWIHLDQAETVCELIDDFVSQRLNQEDTCSH